MTSAKLLYNKLISELRIAALLTINMVMMIMLRIISLMTSLMMTMMRSWMMQTCC